MTITVLLTGFEPFNNARVNPAWEAVRSLDGWSEEGFVVHGRQLPCVFGEANQVLRAAIDYLSSGAVVHSLDMHTPAKRAFIEAFEQRILEPRGLDHRMLFPGPTGTNAVEAALKTARIATGRQTIVSFTNAFHGMTLGALAVTGNSKKRAAAGVPLPFSVTAPYDGEGLDAIAWLERAWSDSGSGIDLPAGVIVEMVQGEGGLRAASPEWLRALADLCARFGVVLIADEVQSGCGRTGTFFAFEEAGIVPDIICLSKSLSGLGMPMALTLLRPDLDVWQPGAHNGTFRGFAPAFATATAALETFWGDDAFAEAVRAKAAPAASPPPRSSAACWSRPPARPTRS